ncbi:hypothetical protein [Enterobacter asburiae]|uniref:hypothetical protein n=1 Tax=Enterobacter asburiae TaxID=61645 RepID=UPI0004A23F97|nr:hypothetical protein [Enterobacter asburiae]
MNNQSKEEGRKMVFDVKDKEAWDFLYACSAGHQGSIVSISGNYNGVLGMTTKKTFKCNAHADIRDYQQLRVDEKTINAILQNCNAKVLFKESEKAVAVNPEPNAE